MTTNKSLQKVSPPTGQAHIPLTMSGLLFIGGGIGYYRSKSIPSLVAGVSLGTGYAISAWLLNQGDGREGHMLSLGISTLLTSVMGIRFYRTRKLFPPGVLVGAGGLTAIYHGINLKDWL